jgi:hypothetical protein
MHGRAPRYLDVLAPRLISREHPDATVLLRRLAIGATRRQRHKDVVVLRVSGHAVSVAVGGHVLQPLPSPSIDHTEHRAGGHVARRSVVAIVAGVEPHLVDGADVVDGR